MPGSLLAILRLRGLAVADNPEPSGGRADTERQIVEAFAAGKVATTAIFVIIDQTKEQDG
jgi:hypothetical protein